MNQKPKPHLTGRVENFALLISVAASVVLIGWIVWLCRCGIDFTDEGFYLNWIAHPSLYKASHTQFGFIYHPLYLLFGGDIVLLRQANILITLALAWLLFFSFFRTQAGRNEPADSWHPLPCAGLSYVLSTSALALLHFWLPTPNYNSLALQALLLCGIALLLAKADSSRPSLLGWGLIGVSGWLAFMAKPTTAAALSVIVVLYLAVSGKMKLRHMTLSVATAAALLLLSAWMIDGSIARFALRLINGAADVQKLQGGYALSAILRWDDLNFTSSDKYTLAGSTLLVYLASSLALSTHHIARLLASLFTLLFSIAGLAVLTGAFPLSLSPALILGPQFWAIPFGATLAVLAAAPRHWSALISRRNWSLALCFVVLPYIFVVGHNGNYWSGATGSTVFWVFVAIVILNMKAPSAKSWGAFLPLAAATQLGIAVLFSISTKYPYRQPQPLQQNSDIVQVAFSGSRLRLASGDADYLHALGRLTEHGGFKPGDPMIDLTGRYPTSLYMIDARAVGLPWLCGGYPGSADMVAAALDRVPNHTLKKAWILTEPTGPRKLSPDILERYDIDLVKNYIEVGTIDSPIGEYPDSYKQHLLKPVR